VMRNEDNSQGDKFRPTWASSDMPTRGHGLKPIKGRHELNLHAQQQGESREKKRRQGRYTFFLFAIIFLFCKGPILYNHS
jgi:hypothetical protein